MIILSAEIESIKTRRDKTVSLQFGTQELTPDKAGGIFQLQGKQAIIAIKTVDFSKEEQEAIEGVDGDIEKTGKTPSQRLRNVFFLLFRQNGEGYTDFNLYYLHKMEQLIGHYKGKLS